MSTIDVCPQDKTERTNRSVGKNMVAKNNVKENQFLNKRFSNIKAIKHVS